MDKRVAGCYILGFTLVELAIVLVVIGIIAAMAIGGTDVLANAQVRSEINKLSKFESALSTYRASNNKFPKEFDNSTRRLNTLALVGLGVEAKDLKSKFAVDTQNNTAYQLQYCAPDPDNSSGKGFEIGDAEASNICLNVGYGVKADGSSNTAEENNIHHLIICNVELLLDDSNILTGSARTHDDSGVGSGEADKWGEAGNYNCDNVTDGYSKFGYKIF
jgi:prepilin-type N-terminal cleavage/methylation domain-containing protein